MFKKNLFKNNKNIALIDASKNKTYTYGEIESFKSKFEKNFKNKSIVLLLTSNSIFSILVYISLMITKKKIILLLINEDIKEKFIKKIDNNTLIIGSSSGIGKDILNLYSYNKNIKLIGTYYETKPKKLITSNQLLIKFDVSQDLKKLPSLIKNYSIKNIYYFATPKINLNSYNPNYKKFYIDYPIQIINNCDKKINFFYPSTIYIKNYKNYYTKMKLLAERKLTKLKKKFHNIIFVRINEINTRQNLMLTKKSLLNFRDFLFNDIKLFKKTFFLK